MAGSYTRRTHIVRITDPNDPTDQGGMYIDVEILDAIAFRTANNKEVILKLDSKNGSPYIVDDTGGGHAKTPGAKSATQRSHMHRAKSSDGQNMLDVEVVDCWSARDQNNDEWILDMQPGSSGSTAFNISDGTGSPFSTRRQHNEIVTSPAGSTKAEAGTTYLTSVRSDNIAFRKENNYEVILSCPSSDDPNAQGVDFGRANTYTTPQGYDPNDTSDSAVVPPTLDQSGDAHNYINFVKAPDGTTMGFFTQDDKIDMGPFWWIRKISGGELACLEVSVQWSNSPPTASIPIVLIQTNFGYDVSVGNDLSIAPIDTNSNQYNGFAAKIMPTNKSVKPQIDISKDMVWWTGVQNTQTGQSGNFTALIWFNVGKIRPLLPKGEDLKFQVVLQDVPASSPVPPAGVGYYIWANYVVYGDGAGVPTAQQAGFGYPQATAANGLLTGPNGWTPYATTYNFKVWNDYNSGTTVLTEYNPQFHPTDFPVSNPNGSQYGFSTLAGAQAWADAENVAWQNEYAAAQAEVARLQALGFHIDNTGAYLVYDAFEIDYKNGNNNTYNPAYVVTSTLADFKGKTTFAYDANNNPQFTFPQKPKMQTQTMTASPGSPWQMTEFDMDSKGNITVALQTSPNPFPEPADDTGGKAGAPVVPAS